MPSEREPKPSARREELLELAYEYVLARGVGDLSLRPLAAAIGSSPRVLLFLFGSKDGVVRALLARARADELELLARVDKSVAAHDLADVAASVWAWLAAEEHRGLLTLWVEGYARSLIAPGGAWTDFARASVTDWLELFAAAQPPSHRTTTAGETQRTLVLAVLRGAMLDLLATGDAKRVGDAVRHQLSTITGVGAR